MIKIAKIFFYTYIVLLTILSYGVTNSSYDELVFTGEGIQNIDNIQEDVDELQQIQAELNEEFKKLNSDYQLKKLLRQDLTVIELNNIKNIVNDYNKRKYSLDQQLNTKINQKLSVIDEKKQILEEKKKFYISLIPYVDGLFSSQYLEYIKGDVQTYNQSNNNGKIETLETKIQEHRDFINESLKKIIETRLDEKIKSLKDNNAFKMLPSSSKIKVIDKSIVKIKIKLNNLENSLGKNTSTLLGGVSHDVIDKKIQTYNIAVDKLENFKSSIK